LGRIIPSWAGTQQLRLAYQVVGRHIAAPAKAGPGQLHPAGSGCSHPGWADFLPPAGPASSLRLGRLPSSRMGLPFVRPGWASGLATRLGRSFRPRPGGPTSPQRPAGPDQEDSAWPGFFSRPPSTSPGWASSTRAPAGRLLCSARLGRIRRIRPGRDYFLWAAIPRPGFFYSGWARPGFPWPRPDYLFLGRFSPL
jgi:hypothetical protein